jgi:hypothetical protein
MTFFCLYHTGHTKKLSQNLMCAHRISICERENFCLNFFVISKCFFPAAGAYAPMCRIEFLHIFKVYILLYFAIGSMTFFSFLEINHVARFLAADNNQFSDKLLTEQVKHRTTLTWSNQFYSSNKGPSNLV